MARARFVSTHIRLHPAVAIALVGLWLGTVTAAYGQEIYVPNYGDGTVSVLNIATNSVTHTISIPVDAGDTACPASGVTCPEAVVLSQDGLFAFVSLDASERVAVIDTTTKMVARQIAVTRREDPQIFRGPNGTFSGNRVYVTSWPYWSGLCPNDGTDPTAQISVIDASNPLTATEIATIRVDSGVWPLTFSNNGEEAYVVGCAPMWDTLHKIDLVNNVAVASTPLSSFSIEVEKSPTDPVVYTSGGACLGVVDLTTFTQVNSLCGFGVSWGVQFRSDGGHAYVLDNAGKTLTTLDTTDPFNPVILSIVPVTSTVNPSELVLSNSDSVAYVVAGFAYDPTVPSEVIEFDISTDTPVQDCSLTVGNGSFELAALWDGPWMCHGAPPRPARLNIKGDGQLARAPKVQFDLEARSTKLGLQGSCNVSDQTTRHYHTIRCLDVMAFELGGGEVVIRGNALHNMTPTTYEIRIADNGKSNQNSPDTFYISTLSGYTTGTDTLRKGDIRVQGDDKE
jgi:YVTN family beta-propeller protein